MLGIIDVGGGTRGIFGAGVFDYCLDNQIVFDCAIGVSAGSANAITYLANQPRRTLRFYDEYAFRPQYMSVREMLRHGEYVNLDYIYSTLSNSDGEYPLDYDAFAQSEAVFEAVATDARTGEPRYFGRRDLGRDQFEPIKASSCVPLASRARMIDGVPYYDGGLSDPIPYLRAFHKGCDRVAVILTRPRSYLRRPDNDRKFARLMRRQYPAIADALENRAALYNRSLRELQELERQGRAIILAPDSIGKLGTLTKKHEPLRDLYRKGYQEGRKLEGWIQQNPGT